MGPRRLALLVGLALLGVGVPVTGALLTDQSTAATVSVTAGSVNAPTGVTLSDTGTDVRVAWTAPASGIAPQDYEIAARETGDSYAGTPTATGAAAPWDHPSPADCSTWFYKVRSSHTNLKSPYTAESSITIDRNDPVVNSAHVVFTGGTVNVADYVRTSGGTTDVYADVTDTCADPDTLTVTFDLTSMGAANNVAATHGSYTPVAGGATYNFKATFALANGAVANTVTKAFDVTAVDPHGNSATTAGTTVTGDGAGPVFVGAETVSAYTNFYDATLGRGEIASDGAAKASGAYVYANFTDASGVETITANLSAGGILTGTTALPLAAGSFTTYANAAVWNWRSAATVINTGLNDANRNFTVTATDKVGNTPTTSANQAVEIDDTAIAAAAASCSNAGNANNLLGTGDTTNFVLGDTVFLDSVQPGWTGTTLTATAVLRDNGSTDFFDLNTDFGLTVFGGTTAATAWNLAGNWVAADTNFANSTITLFSRTTLRLTYQGGSVTDLATTASARFGTTLRDAAGNPVAAAFSETCSTAAW